MNKNKHAKTDEKAWVGLNTKFVKTHAPVQKWSHWSLNPTEYFFFFVGKRPRRLEYMIVFDVISLTRSRQKKVYISVQIFCDYLW